MRDVGNIALDPQIASNAALEEAIQTLKKTQEERKKLDLDLVRFRFAHIDKQLNGNISSDEIHIDHGPDLSLEHLELMSGYLQRLVLDDESLNTQLQELDSRVKKQLKIHPLAGFSRSGDTEGNENSGASYIKTPSGRRRQTLAVLCLGLTTSFGMIALILFLFYKFMPFPWLFFAAYVAWMVYDNMTSPRPNFARISQSWRRNQLFQHFRDYFPIRLVRSDDAPFDASKNYLFGYHPHGVMSCGAVHMATAASGFDQLFPGLCLSLQTLSVNWSIPITHDNISFLGIGDASKKALQIALTHAPGSSALLVTGGAKESMTAHPHTSKVVLKNRAGFVKVAIRNGSNLVPVWAFGENNIFENLAHDSPTLLKWQRKIQKMITFAPLVVNGRGVFSYASGLLPHRRPITVVVGTPIPVEKASNPTDEYVTELHNKYKAGVLELFNNYKDIYDPKAEGIEFV